MKDYFVRLENVWKYYGSTPVVADVSFDINENESIAIMGANGAGKTTLVESICGLTKITKGKIKYNLGSTNWRKKIGIQFQENIYPPGIKVKHLIDFYKDVYKKEKLKIDIEDLINKFDIRRLYKHSITSLSGGELQRVNILLAIINNPKLVFFDEISTGLDIQAKLRLVQLIKDLKQKHKWTILVITHNIEDIVALCERIIVLSRGRKEYDARVVDIIEKYGSLENFISQEVKTTLIEKQIETKKETFFSKYFGVKKKQSNEDDFDQYDEDIIEDDEPFLEEQIEEVKKEDIPKRPVVVKKVMDHNIKFEDELNWRYKIRSSKDKYKRHVTRAKETELIRGYRKRNYKFLKEDIDKLKEKYNDLKRGH